MKIRKIIALLMVLCLFALALSSCAALNDFFNNLTDNNDEDENDESESKSSNEGGVSLPIDLGSYEIIYPEGALIEVENACNKISTSIMLLTKKIKQPKKDSTVAANDDAYEILVGETNRKQSQNAKKALKGNAYSITKDGNKIVIMASNFIILEDAVSYFINNLNNFNDEGKGEILESYTSDPYVELPLTTNGIANYKIVFTDFYNNLNRHSDSSWEETDMGFTETKARAFTKTLNSITGANFLCTSEDNMLSSAKEIVIGKPRGNTDYFFDYYQNGVHIKNGDIYIYGHNHEGIVEAINNFLMRVRKYEAYGHDTEYSLVCESDGIKWDNPLLRYNIPLPEGIKYEGAYSAPENRVYLVYERCERSTFDTYIKLLEENGFDRYFYREAGTTSINCFAGYNKGEDAVWAYYIHDRDEIRIVLEKYEPLPQITTGAKITEPTFTQFGFQYQPKSVYATGTTGMSFVITLEDGSYAIIDGGGSGTAEDREATSDELYNYLVKNNKRTDGKVVISAWFITHGHSDHIGVFETFSQRYGSVVTCKYFIYNQPTGLTLFGAANAGSLRRGVGEGLTQKMYDVAKNYAGAKVYLVHTGCAFEVGGVFVEFMSTYEDLYNHNKTKHKNDDCMPNAVDEYNDTCITFRLYFNKGKSDEATIFILGDNYFEHGERLASMWDSKYMESTIVQAAHHGYRNGVTSGVVDPSSVRSTTYNEIKASYCLWTLSYTHYTSSASVTNILKMANPAVTFYCNCDANGNALNNKFTFNGGVKVETIKR